MKIFLMPFASTCLFSWFVQISLLGIFILSFRPVEAVEERGATLPLHYFQDPVWKASEAWELEEQDNRFVGYDKPAGWFSQHTPVMIDFEPIMDYVPGEGGLIVAAIVILVTYLYIAPQCKRTFKGKYFRTWLMSKYRIEGQQLIRDSFISAVLTRSAEKPQHSHAFSSSARNDARDFMIKFVRLLGRDPFFHQASRSVQVGGYRNNREYVWADDLKTQPCAAYCGPEEVRCIVDVDYYLDLEEELGSNPRITLLYTLEPQAACCDAGDYAFTFNDDNEIVVKVSGGGNYTHKIHHFDSDCFTAVGDYGSTIYLVERKPVVTHRTIILLVPIAFFPKYWYLPDIAVRTISGLKHQRLGRFAPVRKGWIRFDVMTPKGLKRTTARAGTFCCATIAASEDDAVAACARNNSVPISQSTVRSIAGVDKVGAYTLMDFFRDSTPHRNPTVFALEVSTIPYQPMGPGMDPAAKPLTKAFMTPLLRGAYVPLNSESQALYALRERITKVADSTKTTPFTGRLMAEFVEHLIPEPYLAHPVSEDYVREKQARPSQRRITDRGSMLGPNVREVIDGFFKRETATKPGPTRIISQVGAKLKLDFSKFAYPLTSHMKTITSYAFGSAPRVIAEKVAKICELSDDVITTDFSKMDGHTSPACRDLERMVLLRLFAREHHEELVRVHSLTVSQKAFLPFDITYNTGTARCSGEPPTSAFSTIINLFIMYVAIRRSGLQRQEAWGYLLSRGIAGGDDGLIGGVKAEMMTKAAASLGQVLTSEEFKRGEPGVNFLSRFFGPGVWWGDVNSMCDLKRQLAKFHTTHNLPASVTPAIKLKEKCLSYIQTDANTPIIGKFCADVIRAMEHERIDTSGTDHRKFGIRSYWSLKEDNFPNEFGDWMNDLARHQLPDLDFKAISKAKLRSVNDYLTRTPIVATLTPLKPKTSMSIDGAVVDPPPQDEVPKSTTRPSGPGKPFVSRSRTPTEPQRSSDPQQTLRSEGKHTKLLSEGKYEKRRSDRSVQPFAGRGGRGGRGGSAMNQRGGTSARGRGGRQ